MSLLRQIQNDLASDAGDVTTVLMKCKILASRLGSAELSRWVNFELNGYPDDEETPDYRRLAITYYANFANIAWKAERQAIPLQVVPQKYREAFKSHRFRDGIAKAASFAKAKAGAVVPRPELIFALQGMMYPEMQCYSVWGEIGRTEFEQLVSAVKNRVLDFALKIETENPDAGEALPSVTPVAKEKVHMIFQNTFQGPVGNVAQNSDHVNQTANIEVQAGDLAKLVAHFTTHLDELNLDARQKQRAEAQIAALKTELDGEADPEIVNQAGRTLRNITEGAIGSLIATAAQPGVWQWIHHMLANFQ